MEKEVERSSEVIAINSTDTKPLTLVMGELSTVPRDRSSN
jgi:hypothetical protein